MMGNHINTKKNPDKRHKKGFSEGVDIATRRFERVSFKHYLQDLEEDLLDQELLDQNLLTDEQDDTIED